MMFQRKMKTFAKKAELDLINLFNLSEEMTIAYKGEPCSSNTLCCCDFLTNNQSDLVKFFGEDEKEMKQQDFFSIIHSFIVAFEKAAELNTATSTKKQTVTQLRQKLLTGEPEKPPEPPAAVVKKIAIKPATPKAKPTSNNSPGFHRRSHSTAADLEPYTLSALASSSSSSSSSTQSSASVSVGATTSQTETVSPALPPTVTADQNTTPSSPSSSVPPAISLSRSRSMQQLV